MADDVKVVNAGLAIITNRIKGSGTEPKYVHWGTSTTAVASTQTSLLSPGTEARVECTTTREQTTAAYDTYQAVGTIICGATSGAAITEAGLFDASSGGNMFLRGKFAVVNLNQNEGIQFTIKTVFADSST